MIHPVIYYFIFFMMRYRCWAMRFSFGIFKYVRDWSLLNYNANGNKLEHVNFGLDLTINCIQRIKHAHKHKT